MQVIEEPLDAEMRVELQRAATEAEGLLQLVDRHAEPPEVVARIDDFLRQWQADHPDAAADCEELCLTLGSLWGEQLVRGLNWEWASARFPEYDDARAVGVFPIDRRLAIYPMNFVFGCLENRTPVTLSLAYNLLVDGSRIPELPAHGYESVMDHVHHPPPSA